LLWKTGITSLSSTQDRGLPVIISHGKQNRPQIDPHKSNPLDDMDPSQTSGEGIAVFYPEQDSRFYFRGLCKRECTVKDKLVLEEKASGNH